MASSHNQGSSFTEQQRRSDAGMMGSGKEGSGAAGVISAAKEKARDLASGASDLAGQVKDTAQEWASSARAGAGQAWESTREGASRLASNVAGRAGDAWDSAGGFVRRNPLPSLLIAAGVGFLLGQWLSGRRSWL